MKVSELLNRLFTVPQDAEIRIVVHKDGGVTILAGNIVVLDLNVE